MVGQFRSGEHSGGTGRRRFFGTYLAANHATTRASFEEAALPHLDAAYNLARWLTRNEVDAEDVVQEAFLRAFRFYGDFHAV